MTLKVSLLLDGELEPQSVAPSLAQVAADAGLRDRFTLYGLAGDALRGSSTRFAFRCARTAISTASASAEAPS